jgi:asparagine synthase (glutamine-hydrolysing)
VWGEKALSKLNGMFAFAIWDTKEKKLFAARDRVGIKPFFYTIQDKTLFFSSEIKGFLELPVKKEANEKIIEEYLRFGYYDHSSETFFREIFTLPGGSFFEWKGNNISIKKYWDIRDKKRALNNADIQKEFEELLSDSVKLHFRSDVPVGINLSSGIDSNGLLYYSRSLGYTPEAFSMCVPESEEYNECPIIEKVLPEEYKAHWHTCTIMPEDFEKSISEMTKIQDQPFGGIPTIAYGKLNELAKDNNVKVLLEGQGVDELLAGYAYYMPELSQDNKGGLSDTGKGQDLSNEIKEGILKKSSLKSGIPIQTPFSSRLLNAQYRDLMHTKLPRVLRFNDHVSMAYGRELRVPYLDYRIIEFLFHLPAEYKIKNSEHKALLRDVMKKHVPSVINQKPKKAFGAIQTEWFRKYYKDAILDVLNSDSFKKRPYWNYEKFMKRVSEFFEGKGDNSFFIWQAINLEFWFREFID